MRLSDLILAVIHKHGDKGCRGRTRLQKEVYFLRRPLDVQVFYQPHYYGPYSAEVASGVQSLVAEGLVAEERPGPEEEGPVERRPYTYKLQPDGQELLDLWRSTSQDKAQQFKDEFDRLELDEQSIGGLAVASKIYHIVFEAGEPVPKSDLTKRAAQLGWGVNPEDSEQAVNFLCSHKLVKEQ